MIFLDMDGVMCDFITSAVKAHGLIFKDLNWPATEWDAREVLSIEDKDFWHKIDLRGAGFWKDLECFSWTKKLFTELSYIDKVVIASSPSRSYNSYSGKRMWLQKHGYNNVSTMLGSEKHLLSRPGRILIDDYQSNINKWEEQGGVGVLFPMFHTVNPDTIVEEIITQVERIYCAR